jgi:DNA-binding MurR/RpiR family transcriptional regulator
MSTPPLLLRLRSLRGDLKPALARIADLILADPAAVASMTIGDLAAAAECSEASVVRFARQLGFRGYRDLRFRLHEEAVAAATAGRDGEADGDIDPSDDIATMTGKIAAADSRAVHDTVRGLDLDALTRVADAVAPARRIVLFGVGASGLAAMDEQQKLARMGLPAVVHTEAHNGLPAVALLESDDVVIAFSHSGRTAELLDAARIAHDVGARVVVVTGAAGSPLAREADEVLLTAAVESELRSGATASRIAQLTVVDCIFVAVAIRVPDLGREALRRTRDAVDDRRVH